MARKGLEQRMMRRLVDGVAAWATFHQAGHPVGHYDEHMFYTPIREIAEGRGWTAKQQQEIVRSPKPPGAPETIDFVIFRKASAVSKRSPLIFIEVKYLRGDSPGQEFKYLKNDIDKLSPLIPTELKCAQSIAGCSEPAKFLLILARQEELDRTLKFKPKKNKAISEMLHTACGKPRSNIYRSTISTHLKSDHHWQAIAIAERRWPKSE